MLQLRADSNEHDSIGELAIKPCMLQLRADSNEHDSIGELAIKPCYS